MTPHDIDQKDRAVRPDRHFNEITEMNSDWQGQQEVREEMLDRIAMKMDNRCRNELAIETAYTKLLDRLILRLRKGYMESG